MLFAYLRKWGGVKHDIEHNLTTVDAPETMKYIRSIPNVHINKPEKSMRQLIIEHKMPPTRLMRYCCSELKEKGGKGRIKVTGVRWAESSSRKENSGIVKILGKPKTTKRQAEEKGLSYLQTKQGGLIMNDDNSETRRFVEQCYRTTSVMVNPIVDWTDDEVWEFLKHYGCESNPLYKCGETRIGCIGCPMQGGYGMKKDFEKYPHFRKMYVAAFDEMLKARAAAGLTNATRTWADGESVMRWWVGDNPNQITIDDYFQKRSNAE